MSEQINKHAVREMAYYIWASGSARGARMDKRKTIGTAGLSSGSARNVGKLMLSWRMKKNVMAGRPNANIPALLTKDVPGG